jgi:dephospho-CoA kinase
MPASGKSTVAKHILKKEKVFHVRLSEFIWNWLEKQGIKKTNVTGAMFGLYLHTIYDDTPIVKWTRKKIKKCIGAKVILLDSIRTLTEYEKFKKKYKNRFALIAAVAAPDVRLERAVKRARFGDASERSFKMRDAEELKIGIGSVIALADEYIDANVSKKEMLEQTDKAYNRLLRQMK